MELVWDEICENQRWFLTKGWADCPRIRLDPPHWTNKNYQKVPSAYDHRLPSEEDENLRWLWVDEWTQEEWKYAISFGATIGTFTFKEKRSKKHFVRQRIWKRPRIRKIEIGVTEIEEQVIENQRIMIKLWKSPYFPGDRPHYSDNNGHPLTKKQIESRLAPSWLWLQKWNIEIGEHTDKEGWEFATDFCVGGWTNTFKQFVHNVRRRKWVRTRKLAGLIKETKKLERTPSVTKAETISIDPINAINANDMNMNMDDGWDDDDNDDDDIEAKSGPPPKPPFEIDICWKYDKIYRETKQDKTLAIWKPKIEDMNPEMKNDDNKPCFMLGYLALSHRTNPNDNIPTLMVKHGADKKALCPPQELQLVRMEATKGRTKHNKSVNLYRYWLKLIPKQGYIAMGSIVIQIYNEALPQQAHSNLLHYLCAHKPRFQVDKLMCVYAKYIHRFGHPLVEKLLTSRRKSQLIFTLHRAQPLLVSGVYKLVEAACIIRQPASFIKAQSEDNNIKMEHYAACITPHIMDLCVQLWQYNIRIVVSSPLIISYATHFKLAWSSKRITDTSATKAAVWEPILGADEFMVGHLAYGDWFHPSHPLHGHNYKVLIIKAGGSDPDAFKEPLGFECIWSLYESGQKNKKLKNRGFGSGLLLSKVGGSVGLVDDEAPPSASFWRAIPPQGYTPLGDIALQRDGTVAGLKEKIRIDSLLRSHDVPKYVCIKNEYLAHFRELEVDLDNDGKDDIIENKVRSRIWISEKCKALKVHAAIYEQEPVSRDILSPMLCKRGFVPPASSELFPTLNLESIIEDQPHLQVTKAGFLSKKGEGLMAQSRKRLFLLTSDQMIYYYQEIELKGSINVNEMSECDMIHGSETAFFIQTPSRKWELEVVNKSDDDDANNTAIEWINAIRSVKNSDIEAMAESSAADDCNLNYKSEAVMKEEKESEEQKIVLLCAKKLDKFKYLLRETKKENETSESVATAVKWYEDLEQTQSAIDILLAKWPRNSICPPGVVRARSELKELMLESQQVILDDIRALANENMSNKTVLRLHKACCLMSDMNGGQMLISQWITNVLLNNCAVVFAAGNKDSDLQHIDRRFNEYRRQMKDYDKRYNRFIPKWWHLPIQIGSRFCSLMGGSLDDQLTQFAEDCDSISKAKKKCIAFEKELIEDAQRRLCSIEIDVKSWTKWNKGNASSYIKIDDENVMIKGTGICVIALDLLKKKILKKKLFPICKYSSFKQKEEHKMMMQKFLQYIADIDDQTLIIMAANEHSGQCQFLRQFGCKVPKELQDLHINETDFAEEKNLWFNKQPFIYIGRKCKKDRYFTLLLGSPQYNRAMMCRHIITPYIPPNMLSKLADKDSIPFYEGIISQVLERHLDIFVGVEAKHVQQILLSAKSQEELNKIEQDKQWLSAINKSDANSNCSAHFDSVSKIANCMKRGIQNCIKMSSGKPLLDLLSKYNQLTAKYASILAQLLNDCGGNKLRDKVLNFDNVRMHLTHINDGDEHKQVSSPKKRGFTLSWNQWNTEEIQFFVIYSCMIYNSCSKTRELLNELIKMATNDLQKRYHGRIKSDLMETRELFLSIEEQCLQLIRAAVIEKFEFIFQFDKHPDWKIERYKKELKNVFDVYLNNCSKLLTPSALEHFYKVFAAHFSLRMLDQILHSKTLNSANSSSIWIDLPPVFESVILKKVPSRVIKKMQIYIDRCLNPLNKFIQLAYANAGSKYTKLETIATKTENIFSKFFGGGNKNEEMENKNANSGNVAIVTEIVNTPFAQKAVQFYTDNSIKLHILGNVPSYKEIFADDDDDEIILTTNEAAESVAKAIETGIKEADNGSDSDSALPNLVIDNTDSTKVSVSGFAVKKNRKKPKKRAPKAPHPSMKAPQIPATGFGIGLNTMAKIVKKNVKLNRKWTFIEKIMALRGFHVLDQQTIRMLCENAQSNIDAQY